jgi:hypothetical protein
MCVCLYDVRKQPIFSSRQCYSTTTRFPRAFVLLYVPVHTDIIYYVQASRRCPARRKTTTTSTRTNDAFCAHDIGIIKFNTYVYETWAARKRSHPQVNRMRENIENSPWENVVESISWGWTRRRDARDTWEPITCVPPVNRSDAYTRRRLCLRISNVCCYYCFLLVRNENDDRVRIYRLIYSCELRRSIRSVRSAKTSK